jgi:hypothetical protein
MTSLVGEPWRYNKLQDVISEDPLRNRDVKTKYMTSSVRIHWETVTSNKVHDVISEETNKVTSPHQGNVTSILIKRMSPTHLIRAAWWERLGVLVRVQLVAVLIVILVLLLVRIVPVLLLVLVVVLVIEVTDEAGEDKPGSGSALAAVPAVSAIAQPLQ